MKYEIVVYQERKFCVYVHINNVNHKKYFGITCQKPEKRWNKGNGYKTNRHFYGSIQKYGWNNFSHIILYNNLTEDEACYLEKGFIYTFNTISEYLGYNISSGGKPVAKFDENARQKISNAANNRKPIREGYHVSEYNKQRIRETHNIPVLQFTTSMQFVNEYPSLTICEKTTGIKAQHISDVCNGKQRTSGGYIWIRKADYNVQG